MPIFVLKKTNTTQVLKLPPKELRLSITGMTTFVDGMACAQLTEKSVTALKHVHTGILRNVFIMDFLNMRASTLGQSDAKIQLPYHKGQLCLGFQNSEFKIYCNESQPNRSEYGNVNSLIEKYKPHSVFITFDLFATLTDGQWRIGYSAWLKGIGSK